MDCSTCRPMVVVVVLMRSMSFLAPRGSLSNSFLPVYGSIRREPGRSRRCVVVLPYRPVVVAQRDAAAAALAALAAVVAVAVGAQRLHVGVDADLLVVHGDGRVILAQAIAAEGGGGAGGDRFLGEVAAGDDVDHAAGGAAAVLHGAAAAHDFDAFDLVQRHHAEVGRGQVVGVLLDAVHQDEGVAGAGHAEAAQVHDGVVGRTAGVQQVDAGLRGQQVLHGAGAAGGDVLGGDHRDRDRQRGGVGRHALRRDGDGAEFRGGGSLLGGGQGRRGTEQDAGAAAKGTGFHLHDLEATRDPAGHSRWEDAASGGPGRGRPDCRTGRYRAAMRLAHGDRCGGSTGWARSAGLMDRRRGCLPVSRLPFARGRQVLRSCRQCAPKAPVRGRNCITAGRGRPRFVTITG